MGLSMYTLDHGDYFQITLEWIDNSTIVYAYVHKVEVMPDDSLVSVSSSFMEGCELWCIYLDGPALKCNQIVL